MASARELAKRKEKVKPEPEPEPQPADYVDAEAEFDEERFETEESDVRHVVRDFTGGEGISGKTDLTAIQAVLLTQFRLLQEDYHERFPELRLDKMPQWFEVYRLSIGRGSRKETVDILRGRMELANTQNANVPGMGRW